LAEREDSRNKPSTSFVPG